MRAHTWQNRVGRSQEKYFWVNVGSLADWCFVGAIIFTILWHHHLFSSCASMDRDAATTQWTLPRVALPLIAAGSSPSKNDTHGALKWLETMTLARELGVGGTTFACDSSPDHLLLHCFRHGGLLKKLRRPTHPPNCTHQLQHPRLLPSYYLTESGKTTMRSSSSIMITMKTMIMELVSLVYRLRSVTIA